MNKTSLLPVLKKFVAKWKVQAKPNGLMHAMIEEMDKVPGN